MFSIYVKMTCYPIPTNVQVLFIPQESDDESGDSDIDLDDDDQDDDEDDSDGDEIQMSTKPRTRPPRQTDLNESDNDFQ